MLKKSRSTLNAFQPPRSPRDRTCLCLISTLFAFSVASVGYAYIFLTGRRLLCVLELLCCIFSPPERIGSFRQTLGTSKRDHF